MRIATFILFLCVAVHAAVAQTTQPATDADIQAILRDRIDARHQSVGIVVGIIDPAGRRVVSFGQLDAGDKRILDGDTLFEIGSISKVFTSLLLADMVRHGEVALDDPVAKFLPVAVKVPQRGGHVIELIDLATHTSGLPRMPDNFAPKDPANPYADYTVQKMYTFLSGYQLKRDIGSQFEYSNLGVGLLGHVLAMKNGTDYETLLRSRICDPLGMPSTRITLTPEMQHRFAIGHDPAMKKTENWDLPTFAGAGAIRSTANDLLRFVAMHLGLVKSNLNDSAAAMLKVRRPTGDAAMDVALAWMVSHHQGHEIIWHSGGTGGYRSFIGFDAARRVGVVVLSNAATAAGVDDIGMHLLDPALPLLPAPRVHKQVPAKPELYDRYVGSYVMAPTFILTVTRDGDHLFVQATGQPKFEVFPEGDRDYFWKIVDAQVTFEVDGNGKTTQLILHQNGRDLPAAKMAATTRNSPPPTTRK